MPLLNFLKFSISRKSDQNYGRESARLETHKHGRRDVINYANEPKHKRTPLDQWGTIW